MKSFSYITLCICTGSCPSLVADRLATSSMPLPQIAAPVRRSAKVRCGGSRTRRSFFQGPIMRSFDVTTNGPVHQVWCQHGKALPSFHKRWCSEFSLSASDCFEQVVHGMLHRNTCPCVRRLWRQAGTHGEYLILGDTIGMKLTGNLGEGHQAHSWCLARIGRFEFHAQRVAESSQGML